jgi:hypothetical protein
MTKRNGHKKLHPRVIEQLMTFPKFPSTFREGGRVVRHYRYIIVAVIMFFVALYVNNHGLSGLTFGLVVGRVVEAAGDVFADRGFTLDD